MISTLILTKNEEHTIGAALASLTWCDDVVVLDAASSDRTPEVVRQHGARLQQPPVWGLRQPFGGDEARYRNWAIHNITYRYPWLLVIDADERVTEAAVRAMHQALRAAGNVVAYQIRRRDFFQGTWLRHVQTTPSYIRLFRPQSVRYRRPIHPVLEVDGAVGVLSGFLDHEPFSKGIADWVTRHNHYSSLEAREIQSMGRGRCDSGLEALWSDLQGSISGASLQRRRFHQKRLFYRLPARPLLKFVLLYGLKGGFLDGRAGFNYALLTVFYEYLIVLKQNEAAPTSH